MNTTVENSTTTTEVDEQRPYADLVEVLTTAPNAAELLEIVAALLTELEHRDGHCREEEIATAWALIYWRADDGRFTAVFHDQESVQAAVDAEHEDDPS